MEDAAVDEGATVKAIYIRLRRLEDRFGTARQLDGGRESSSRIRDVVMGDEGLNLAKPEISAK